MQNNRRRKEILVWCPMKIKYIIFRFQGLLGEFCFALATYAAN